MDRELRRGRRHGHHYGTVDLFAGRYNDVYRKAELDHLENFDTSLIKATSSRSRRLDERWVDPFAAERDGERLRIKNATTARRSPPSGNRRTDGRSRRDEELRTDENGIRLTALPRCSPDEPQMHPSRV